MRPLCRRCRVKETLPTGVRPSRGTNVNSASFRQPHTSFFLHLSLIAYSEEIAKSSFVRLLFVFCWA